MTITTDSHTLAESLRILSRDCGFTGETALLEAAERLEFLSASNDHLRAIANDLKGYSATLTGASIESPETRTAITLMLNERIRQIKSEGYTTEDDDKYIYHELAVAASEYARASAYLNLDSWPWALDFWKPSDNPVRNLEKAGALIIAEIERLQRAEQKSSEAA